MGNSEKVRITFEPDGKNVLVEKGATVLEAAIKAGLGIRSECGGLGTCGKCKILVRDYKAFTEITDVEKRFLTPEELKKGLRLACQARILKEGSVYVPTESKVGERKILEAGFGRNVPLEPAVKKVHLLVPKPSLNDVRADHERLVDTLLRVLSARGERSGRIQMDHELLANIPDILRKAEWDVTLVLREGEILGIERGNTERENYGLAIDIGTSKIVIYLVNVNDGEIVGINSIENPQLMFGEDIMTRLTFAMKSPENRSLLQKVLIDGINKAIEEISDKGGVNRERIYEAIVVGNTAMHHLFLGIETRYLALSPYVPAVRDFVSVKAEKIGMRIRKSGYVLTLPIIGGFVGADGAADLLATGLHKSDEISLLLDIGTNTEVFLGNRKGIIACSAASGPAFEGGHIKFGMKASTGAIEKVDIDCETCEVKYKTIGDAKPVGLCGSAIIDVVAGLLKCGLIDKNGRIRKELGKPRIREEGGEVEFVIAWRDEAGIKEDITITQRDVREIQLAKAAIYAAQSIIMKRMGIKPKEVEKVFVAGAFGSGINLENAILIGLFPEEHGGKVEFVGNTAIAGAKIALISRSLREESKDLLKLIKYIELSLDPSFQEEFINATELPHRDLNRFPAVKNFLKERNLRV